MIEDTSKRMENVMNWLNGQLGGLRTGMASVSMVENIKIVAYGNKMTLKSVAGISVPDRSTILIEPWDHSLTKGIEKAIGSSTLGIMPMVDDNLLKIRIPELTGSRRDELARVAKDLAEKAKIRIRQIRREINAGIKKDQDESLITEDESEKNLDAVQKTTNVYIKKIDTLLARKEKEIKTI